MEDRILSLEEKNVGDVERIASVVLGGALTAWGLKSRSVPGIVVAGVGGALLWRGASGYCPLYGALGVSTASELDDRQVSVSYGRGVRVEEMVEINAAREHVFAFWRNFENLPRFMTGLERVQLLDDGRSRWTAKGPAGSSVEWEAEIINEIPGELIGWRSVEGSQIDNAGSVHFSSIDGGRATEVRVLLRYDPPAGVLGAKISKILGEDPARNIAEDLERLKDLLETGGLER